MATLPAPACAAGSLAGCAAVLGRALQDAARLSYSSPSPKTLPVVGFTMGPLAGKAGDCLVALTIVRNILGHEALDSIASVRAAEKKGRHSVRFSLRKLWIVSWYSF